MMGIRDKIKSKNARCAVIGLGYVGLPLLCEFAKSGYKAIGVDLDENKVSLINESISYIEDVPSNELKELVGAGKIEATSDYSVLRDVDIVSVCVPTPLRKSKEPDITYIVSACAEIAKYFHKGQLIILESTTYPGTTEEVVLPILLGCFSPEDYPSNIHEVEKKVANSPLRAGRDFFLAFSPERVDPGNPMFKTKDIPKVIGGISDKCTEVAVLFYRKMFPEIVPVSSTRAAEMVKLLENTFRSVNIALANEMALMSDALKVDIWEIIEAAATKPFGFMPFYPGPGLGGHCIPIDPLYLTWKARLNGFEPKFIELASEVNQKMPKNIVVKVQDKLNEKGKSLCSSNVLVIGVAYKKDVSDTRESPSIEIIQLLQKKKAKVSYYDPHVPHLKTEEIDMSSVELSEEILRKADCVVIATDHSEIDYKMLFDNVSVFVDTRNAFGRFGKTKQKMENGRNTV